QLRFPRRHAGQSSVAVSAGSPVTIGLDPARTSTSPAMPTSTSPTIALICWILAAGRSPIRLSGTDLYRQRCRDPAGGKIELPRIDVVTALVVVVGDVESGALQQVARTLGQRVAADGVLA